MNSVHVHVDEKDLPSLPLYTFFNLMPRHFARLVPASCEAN